MLSTLSMLISTTTAFYALHKACSNSAPKLLTVFKLTIGIGGGGLKISMLGLLSWLVSGQDGGGRGG